MVPNLYTVELNPTDYDRLADFEASLSEELVAAAQEHAETQRYQPGGPLAVTFAEADDLTTGTFRVTSASSRRAPQTGMPSRPERGRGQSAAPPAPAPAPEPAPRPVAPDAALDNPAIDDLDDRTARPQPVRFDPLAADPFAPPAPVSPAALAPASASAAVPPAAPPPAPAAPRAVIPPAPPTHRGPTPSTSGAMARPWLDIDGERYPLITAMTVLGRDESCDVLIEDPGVSRRHCEFRVTTDGPHIVCSVRDLGSTNGTFVNSERITSQRLTPGDRVTVGRTSFTYRLGRR
jgi:hypothetical protein